MSYIERERKMEANNNFIAELEKKLLNPEADLSSLSAEQQFELIKSKAAEHTEAITPKPSGGTNDLLSLLRHSKQTKIPLKIKFGIDPTGPNIHLGHAVSLLMLRRFQQMGHQIELVVGDFTGQIGDPSGRMSKRDVLTQKQIKENMSTYTVQASRIINLEQNTDVTVTYNSEWLAQMTMMDWMPILQKISGNQLIQREDFIKRLQAGNAVSAAEILYPLFMAYDSVVIKPDIELGGIDQLLNLHWCRELMKLSGQESETFILVDLLPGTTGEKDETGQLVKMSKSKKNFIMVTEHPDEVYGKVMSIPDDVMWIWYKELTEISKNDLDHLERMVDAEKFHPMEAKRLLARTVVGTFNHFDQEIIKAAEESFNQKFGKKKILTPESTLLVQAQEGEKLIDVLSKVTKESKSNIRKMTTPAGPSGIKILVGDKYEDVTTESLATKRLKKDQEIVVKVGKRKYFRITVNT